MGFTNGTGPEGTPTITNTPQTVADLTRLRDLVVERGNRFKGTTAERDTFTLAGFAVEGHEWFDTTLGTLLTRRSGAWKRDVSFRIFSIVRGGMNDGTLYFQVPTEDTAKDTEPAFTYAYNAGDGKLTLEAGVYLLHATSHPGAVVSGTTFMQLRAGTQGVLDRKNPVLNADPVMSVNAQFRADGTEGLYIEMQKATGGSSSSSGSLRVTRVSGL